MSFTDRFEHVIDQKGRLAIPSQHRNAMNPETDGTSFFLLPEGRYLQLIPEKLFERIAGSMPAGLMPAPEIAKIRRYVFSNASRLELDGQGRVMIPDRFMIDSKNKDPLARGILSREVMLVGNGDRLELWNRADYIAHMRELELDRPSFQPRLQQVFGESPLPSTPLNAG